MSVPPNPGVPSRMPRHRKPVHRKVYAATVGAGASGVLSTFVLWLTGIAFGGDVDAGHVKKTLEAVPSPLAAFVLLVIPTLLTFAAGYIAKSRDN